MTDLARQSESAGSPGTTAFGTDYRIVRRLGEGGMATVYLAEDLRHQRRVALKVLRPELAAVLGGERFLTEIRTTAALQHPHILPLFDSGQAVVDGLVQLYYVMPFVDGETLRQKLDRERQLSVAEATRIARAVAAALDYAHRQGVIHRDIKPENVMLFEGQALVADFGIGLAVSQAGGSRLTETGISIGTPRYMSPEQAAADRALDGRTDIYSLGAMTFEMLVGRCPFEAGSTPALMSKLMTEAAPHVRDERSAVPAHVDAAVNVALAKLPADRFATAAQFAEALEHDGFARTQAQPASTRTVSRYVWPAVAGAAVAAAWLGWSRPRPVRPIERVQVSLPPERPLSIAGSRASPIAISADGKRLAYETELAGVSKLVIRQLDTFDWRELVGTERARQPFFSPDGESIAFFAGDSLYRVSFAGGAPIAIALAKGLPLGGSWGPEDQIVFSVDSGLFRVQAQGATPVAIPLPFRQRSIGARWPEILPDGKHVLLTTDSGTIAIEIKTSRAKRIFAGEQARYLPTGHLLFHIGDERVRVVPFDARRLEVSGAESPVLDNVFRGPGSGAAFFVVARDAGTLLYVPGDFHRTLSFVDRYGRETPIPAAARGYRFPSVSPNGRYVAISVDPRPNDLWVIDVQRGSAERQRFPEHDGWGVWSPDGKRIAFRRGPLGIQMRDFPFVGDPVPIGKPNAAIYPKVWTRNDELLTTGTGDIIAISTRDSTIRSVVATSGNETSPALSADERWIAFNSDVSGRNEVYVQAYPGGAGRVAVSSSGGVEPAWSRDGSELYYRRGNTIFTQPVRITPRFELIGPPKELFTGGYDFTQNDNWALTPDGRFLMIRGNRATTTEFQMVLNWYAELRAKGKAASSTDGPR